MLKDHSMIETDTGRGHHYPQSGDTHFMKQVKASGSSEIFKLSRLKFEFETITALVTGLGR